ncbi:pseudomonalisin [Collimonas arenae]|uniref:Pseudomonalisin n=1 Tax=Collimonas arenae TaxID=279058 RepID=A0A127PNX6_9BURK|nr:S53 family peptidase [Collimonas arenae]AMO99453.1 pseudomonalisin [Collimonas arenae]AMP09354.1 pseudomonalisin [Collimonas arenae]
MKSKVPAGNFAIPQVSALSLALSLVFASLSVHAAVADTGTWVATKTQAFLPQVQANQKSLAADASIATPAASAVQLAQGEPVHVTLSLNLRNEAKLDKFLQDLHTPGTASYGKFLKPAQFAALYAPTEKDVAAVVAHLSKSGFVNIRIAPNRQLVFADGTAATVQTAFRTSLKRFQQDGRKVFANTDAAQVPAALGNIVGSVLGLQNVAVAQTHHRWIPNAQGSVALQAKAKPSATPIATPHSPAQFPAIYNAGSTPTASNTTVAIISEGNIDPTISDLGTFTSANGFATVNTSVVQTGPAGSDYSDTSGQVEWNLDSQTITGTSGGAVQQLIFYASPDMNFSSITASYNQAVSDNLAKVINVSLGGCESDTHSDGTQAADDNVFKQAVAQGQTFSISTGDAGTYNCQTSSISGAPGVPKNKSTYDVSEPASSPYVIAVGGTTLYTASGAYSSETVWNEGLSAIGVYDANGDSDPTKRLWATGGGYSKYEAAPSYQSGVIAAGKTTRGLPDIAFDAASASGATIYYNGQTGTVGGTSLAAPIFTGTWARLQSANGNALGFPAASFYKYFPLAANAALLHDVTSGTNGASSSYGYKAAKGWDATTGFGSLNIANLNTFIQNTSDFAR